MQINKNVSKRIVFNLKLNSIEILIGNYRKKRIDIYETMEIFFIEADYLNGNILNEEIVKSKIQDAITRLDLKECEFTLVLNSHILIKSKVYPFLGKKELRKIIKYDMDNIFMEGLEQLEIDYVINDFDELDKTIEILYFACKKERIVKLTEYFNSMDIEILYIDHIINAVSKGVMEIYRLENKFIFVDINGDFVELYYYNGRQFLERYKLNLNSLEVKDRLEKADFIVADKHSYIDNLSIYKYRDKTLCYKESSIVSLGGLIRHG